MRKGDLSSACADELCRDQLERADGTRMRAGVIGEIWASDPITDAEHKVVRAAHLGQR
jgi:predicted metal-dependent phosphotriesterase family hydrolase